MESGSAATVVFAVLVTLALAACRAADPSTSSTAPSSGPVTDEQPAKARAPQATGEESRARKVVPSILKSVRDGDVEQVRQLLKRGADANEKTSKTISIGTFSMTYANYTVLMVAVELGSIDIVEALLAAGADPNAKTTNGALFPLMVAANKGLPRIARLLLSHGANPNLKADEGISALIEVAGQEGPFDPRDEELLADVASTLVDAGARVDDAVDATGSTPLTLAARWGNRSLVHRLIAAKANLQHEDALGMTALAYARQYGHRQIAQDLERAGAR